MVDIGFSILVGMIAFSFAFNSGMKAITEAIKYNHDQKEINQD